jgi:ectoine hydroxylase-related dioxygenase (phytanoyl-CoA dioxygenase family)
MDWIVTVSPGETAGGELAAATAQAAYAAFEQNGCVLLRGAFPLAIIEAMHGEYVSQFGALDPAAMQAEAAKPPPNRFLRVGDARYDIAVEMTGAFGNPHAFANRLLYKFLRALLGEDMRLSNFTLVVAHPGAPQQHAHRDHGHLFLHPSVGPNLPVYAVNVAVPLIDVDIETGPTGIWLGSHRWPQNTPILTDMTACTWRRGDCVLLDYRTMHAGLANFSRNARPIMYMVYACPWFFDDVNHFNRISLDLPIEHYNALPEPARRLLIRAYSYATRARWHEAGPTGLAAEHTPKNATSRSKLGRNDPCHCGSGKKFKQCHGRSPQSISA